MWLDRASAFASRPRPYRDLGTERAGFTGLTWFLCKLGDRPAGPHGQPILFMSSTLPLWPPDNTARAVVLIRSDPNRTGEYRATLSLPRHRPPRSIINHTNGSPPSLATTECAGYSAMS